MESDGRSGHTYPDIATLEAWDIQLQYMTVNARKAAEKHGLGTLPIHYQVMLMTHCYNYSEFWVNKFLNGIEKNHRGCDGRQKIDILGRGLASKSMRKSLAIAQTTDKIEQEHDANFSLNGVKNLLLLDRAVAVADYSVDLEAL